MLPCSRLPPYKPSSPPSGPRHHNGIDGADVALPNTQLLPLLAEALHETGQACSEHVALEASRTGAAEAYLGGLMCRSMDISQCEGT